jgi:hypothetical protein
MLLSETNEQIFSTMRALKSFLFPLFFLFIICVF